MDEAVKQAMARWPDVPHCTGWLALDARGNWRMRDEIAQATNAAGDPIRNEALLAFIRRNYTEDETGGWYFQNGPQRVYVDLECTPFVCRTDPQQGLALQVDKAMRPSRAWLDEGGRLGFANEEICAVLDDRDVEPLLNQLHLTGQSGQAVSDEALIEWLARAGTNCRLTLSWQSRELPVDFIANDELPKRFNFLRRPRPQSESPVPPKR